MLTLQLGLVNFVFFEQPLPLLLLLAFIRLRFGTALAEGFLASTHSKGFAALLRGFLRQLLRLLSCLDGAVVERELIVMRVQVEMVLHILHLLQILRILLGQGRTLRFNALVSVADGLIALTAVFRFAFLFNLLELGDLGLLFFAFALTDRHYLLGRAHFSRASLLLDLASRAGLGRSMLAALLKFLEVSLLQRSLINHAVIRGRALAIDRSRLRRGLVLKLFLEGSRFGVLERRADLVNILPFVAL
mmetsp:Transcript_32269/g.49397  ORF Transcript_32269/g.49397 Transcript_32269/m.49397 type:complete len:247 (+) Transcript_32269:992-1732(+)